MFEKQNRYELICLTHVHFIVSMFNFYGNSSEGLKSVLDYNTGVFAICTCSFSKRFKTFHSIIYICSYKCIDLYMILCLARLANQILSLESLKMFGFVIVTQIKKRRRGTIVIVNFKAI